jgi:tetratricopeptide (TPR) repeat protein
MRRGLNSALVIAGLLLGAAPAALAAPPRWTMIQGATMTVVGDGPADRLRDVATQIEQFRAVVGGLNPNAGRPPSLPTTVFVFGTRKAMGPFVPLSKGKPAQVAGYFQRADDMNVIVMALEGFEESAAIVYHEYAHLLLANGVRSIPVWVNEGLAEYYSSYKLSADARSAEIGGILAWRVALLRDRLLPLSQVIAVDSTTALHDATERRSIFYAESWALIHYLLSEVPDGGARLNHYAAMMAEGRRSADAFSEAFGATPADFEKQLRLYLGRPTFTATRYTFKERIAVDQPGPPRVLGAVEADAWLGDLQRRLGRTSEAVPRIEAAAAAGVDSAVAQRALGLLRVSQQRIGEGVAALERARALAPDDFATQFLHGVTLLRADRGAGKQTASATASLARAVALRSESSDAHAWLAYAQMLSHDTLPDARASILHAIELAPGRLDYRLRYADISILQGRIDKARTLLTAIAAVAFDTASAAAARARLEAIAASAERRIELRRSAPGEQRAAGLLTGVACAADGVRFEIDAGGQPLVAIAPRLEDVELIVHLGGDGLRVVCGVRNPPDNVLLTWRNEVASGDGAARKVVVAVEFLPAGYVP